MKGINGHTCITDDGGTPGRRCEACEAEPIVPSATDRINRVLEAWEALLKNSERHPERDLIATTGMRVWAMSRAIADLKFLLEAKS